MRTDCMLPNLQELTKEAQEHETALKQQQEAQTSDAYLAKLEAQRQRVLKVARETVRQLG